MLKMYLFIIVFNKLIVIVNLLLLMINFFLDYEFCEIRDCVYLVYFCVFNLIYSERLIKYVELMKVLFWRMIMKIFIVILFIGEI